MLLSGREGDTDLPRGKCEHTCLCLTFAGGTFPDHTQPKNCIRLKEHGQKTSYQPTPLATACEYSFGSMNLLLGWCFEVLCPHVSKVCDILGGSAVLAIRREPEGRNKAENGKIVRVLHHASS